MNVREKKPPEAPKLIKNRHMIYDNRCRKVQAYITTAAQKRKIGSQKKGQRMTEQNLLEFSNNKVYSSRNMSLMGKKEKKIISEKSLIKKVRN